MARRRPWSITKGLKDYIVPIIGLVLIFFLIYSFFREPASNETLDSIKYENQIGIDISLDSDITDGFIIYPGENRKQIEWDTILYKWERVFVKEGSISLDFPSVWNFRLDKNGEFKYEENGNVSLESSDLWVDSLSDIVLNLKFGQVILSPDSHASFSQNEVESSIYLISWTAEVRNLSWASGILWSGQKITISRMNASEESLDFSLYREELDEFFKASDWFIKNNGSKYLDDNEVESWEDDVSSSPVSSGNSILSFDNIQDESYVSSESITISGNYAAEYNVANIRLNGIDAQLDTTTNTFSFEEVDSSSRENDLVFKVYDESNDLISKFLYVVYNQWWGDSEDAGSFSVKHYDVDGSQFTFTSPTTKNTYTTSTTFVTIKGNVLAQDITKVSVNGYVLKSFNGSTWRYHADVRYNNLKTGTNVYEVKYFDATGKLVYSNDFKIFKRAPGSTSSSLTPANNIYSDEAQL